MPNSPSHHHRDAPRASCPPERAQGLEPEFTARPKLTPSDLPVEMSADPGLSIEPEDLGAHFLSEAIEQGDFDPERSAQCELTLFEPAEGDELREELDEVIVRSAWDQMLDSVPIAGARARERAPEAEPLAERDYKLAASGDSELRGKRAREAPRRTAREQVPLSGRAHRPARSLSTSMLTSLGSGVAATLNMTARVLRRISERLRPD